MPTASPKKASLPATPWPEPPLSFGWIYSLADPNFRFGEVRPKKLSECKAWCVAVQSWLKNEYGDDLVGIVLPTDESQLHIHFFVVGNANLLHPGLKQEFEHGRRLESKMLRHERHVAGLKAVQDRYHEVVGKQFGLARRSENGTGPRIASRPLALRLQALEKRVTALDDAESQKELEKLGA